MVGVRPSTARDGRIGAMRESSLIADVVAIVVAAAAALLLLLLGLNENGDAYVDAARRWWAICASLISLLSHVMTAEHTGRAIRQRNAIDATSEGEKNTHLAGWRPATCCFLPTFA